MMAEIKVSVIVERHEVDVCMWHVKSDYSHSNLDTGTYLFDSAGDLAAKAMQLDKEGVVEVENIVNLLLGDAEDMTLYNRIDIEECQTIVGLCNLVAGNLACHYA